MARTLLTPVLVPESNDDTAVECVFTAGDEPVTTTGTISASTTDDSYNGTGLPVVAAGETITVGGFVAGANNGAHVVVSRTSSKIVVAENLTTEAGGGDETITTPARHNAFVITEKEECLVRNAHATDAKTVTVTSAPDQNGRTNDITAFSIAAGKIYALPYFELDGWRQPDGRVYLQGEDFNIQFCVLRLPR